MTATLVTRNLRFLLWNGGSKRKQWANHLADWLGGDVSRAVQLLQGRILPNAIELHRLADHTGRTQEDILFANLVAEVSILGENLRYLIDGPKRGRKKALAEALGIKPITLSRWLAGKQIPARKHLLAMQAYFGLPAGTDLETLPLFLELSPVGGLEQREWLHRQIDGLDEETLRQLFPALEKLLR
ncbi:MAG: helix-turn-helix transcriptional regulator [Candidatus Competibacteraceae bacterium]